MKKHWSDRLVKINACPEAVEYARGFATAQEAWDACPRGDWMGWWIDLKKSRRQRQLIGAAILRYALPDLESDPVVALIVVWMAEAIERGDAEEIEAAAEAAWAVKAPRTVKAAEAAEAAETAWTAWAAGAIGSAGVIRMVHPRVPR
jgi:hypothetical protein